MPLNKMAIPLKIAITKAVLLPEFQYVIYKITCTATSECYVGCSKNPRQRFRLHYSDLKYGRTNTHRERMAAHFRLFGEDAFVVDILETIDTKYLSTAMEREQFHMMREMPTYGKMPYAVTRHLMSPAFRLYPITDEVEELRAENARLRELLKEKGIAA